MGALELRRACQAEFFQRAAFCSGTLSEARRLVTESAFGSTLSGLLARACDVLDDMDEILITLNPREHREAYLRAAELHRALEEIQALVPRQFRGLPREKHCFRLAYIHRKYGATADPIGE